MLLYHVSESSHQPLHMRPCCVQHRIAHLRLLEHMPCATSRRALPTGTNLFQPCPSPVTILGGGRRTWFNVSNPDSLVRFLDTWVRAVSLLLC